MDNVVICQRLDEHHLAAAKRSAWSNLEPDARAEIARHDVLGSLFTERVMYYSKGFVEAHPCDDVVSEFITVCGWLAKDVANHVIERWATLRPSGTKDVVKNDDCPICLCGSENEPLLQLACGHLVHESCWMQYAATTWRGPAVRCSICRAALG